MNNKNKKIVEHKNRKIELVNQVKKIKSKLPAFIIGFALFTVVLIYYLVDKVYIHFGSTENFIKFGVLAYVSISLVYIFINYLSIQKKVKELKLISNRLYKLMKLEIEETNE